MSADKKFTAKASILIQAPAARVWEALTNPDLIKQYMFGSQVTTDWKVGSLITYKGIWQGKPYEDKGTVVEVVPGKRLVSTYWSPMGGKPDLPENYQTVRYELFPTSGGTRLEITQDNNETQQDADHSAQNWNMMLESLKKLLEV